MLNIGAIVPAAGLSSRMKAFKPLLPVNGIPMIQLTVQNILDGGTESVCVVLGREGERIRESLDSLFVRVALIESLTSSEDLSGVRRVMYAWNRDFASSDMLQSIKFGLRALLGGEAAEKRLEAVFVVPGDMPVISPGTFGAIRRYASACPFPVVIPRCLGEKGHPLILKRECFDTVLNFEGEGGLKEALRAFDLSFFDVEDEGILIDADEPETFEYLSSYARKTKGISNELVESFLVASETPQHIKEHCFAVAGLATRMVGELNRSGFCLDRQLVISAALLHDMNRLSKNHAQVAAEVLQAQGFNALARIVEQHHGVPDVNPDLFTEVSLVFLADKLVKEADLVTPEMRYESALQKFSVSTEVGQRVRGELDVCKQLVIRYEEITGDRLSR